MKMKLLALITFLGNTIIPVLAKNSVRRRQKKDRILSHEEENVTTIGFAINGGAFTSANGGGAIMRGFQQHKITLQGREDRPSLEAFDFMAGVSGGNLPLFLYHYADDGISSDDLLDASGISDPSLITREDLEKGIPENSLFDPLVTTTVSTMYKCLMETKLHHKPFWTSFIHTHFLQKFGISNKTPAHQLTKRMHAKHISLQMVSSMIGPPSYYPDWNWVVKDKGLQTDLRAEMPKSLRSADEDPLYQDLRHKANDLVRSSFPHIPGTPESPFIQNPKFIMNTTILLKALYSNGYQTEIPSIFSDEGLEISFPSSTLVFDPIPNESRESPVKLQPFKLNLKDISTDQGTSLTADQLLAFPTDMVSIVMPAFLRFKVFPKSLYDLAMMPSVVNIPTGDNVTANEKRIHEGQQNRPMVFADGGYNDGSGLPALVRKKARKIILTICNTPDQFGYSEIFGGNPLSFATLVNDMGLGSYFGLNNGDFINYAQNQLFDLYSKEGTNHYVNLVEKFKSLHEAGEPMIATIKGVRVRNNPFWGVEGGWELDLTIIWMRGVPKKFASLVPLDCVTPPKGKNITENGFFTNKEFRFVPNLNHITIDGPYLPDFKLKKKAARMTQILGSMMIHHSWNGLKGIDGEVKFEGFGAIFEEKSNPTASAPSFDHDVLKISRDLVLPMEEHDQKRGDTERDNMLYKNKLSTDRN